jgi:hypothetical protein
MRGKKRLFLAAATIASVGAVIALATGVTFGLFSSTAASSTSTFTAGTVSLTKSAETTCTAGPLSPGDASLGWTPPGAIASCTYTVHYSGNVPAYLALNVAIASTHAGPASPQPNYGGGGLQWPGGAPGLYDSTTHGLQLLVTSNNGTTYMTGTTLGGSTTSGANASKSDLLVDTSPFSNGDDVTFTVDYQLPLSADNSYQGAASSITLTAHAVQSAHNPDGGTTGTPGQQVPAGDVNWG